MSALLGLDRVARVAHVAGSARWVDVESALADEGLTLGALPSGLFLRTVAESFALDDRLRPSPRFGQLTDAALAVRAELPDGRLTRSTVSPRRATGPDLARCVVGHRGAGRLVDAQLQVWRLSGEPVLRVRSFDGWAAGCRTAVAALRAGVAPAWWKLDRAGKRVRLCAALVGGPDEVGRFDAVVGGRIEGTGAAETVQREVFPRPDPTLAGAPAEAVRACRVAALGRAVRGVEAPEVWDLRPEGVTVYGRGTPQLEAGWDDLAATFAQALGRVI